MALHSTATMTIANQGQERETKPDWWVKTERDLYRYAELEHTIRRQTIRLQELYARKEDGRRITSAGWGGAVPNDNYTPRKYHVEGAEQEETEPSAQGGKSEPWEMKITEQIADCEAEIRRAKEFREMMELAVDYEFAGEPEMKEIIRIYYWMGLPKGKARRQVMERLYMAKPTVYRRVAAIVRRMARLLGHKKD